METLKEKYNKLLESYKTGSEFIIKDPEGKMAEKAKAKLEKISKEMEEVLKQIPDATDEEITNGFDLPVNIPLNEKVTAILENEGELAPDDMPVEMPVQPKVEEPKEEPKAVQIVSQETNTTLQSFGDDWKIASQLAKSDIIPDNYKGKPQNVIVALGLANQMGLPPFTVMQNLSVIRGKASWSGSFAKTLIERTGKYRNLELNYIGKKGEDSYGCYLSATRVSDGKEIKGPEVTMKMAKDEGWTSNKKWLTLTELMLAYRCQSFFCRIYCPEAMNGIYTDDEASEISTANERKPIEDIL